MVNIAKAFTDIGNQIQAVPGFVNQIIKGPQPEPNYLTPKAQQTLDNKAFTDKGLYQTPSGAWTSKIPMPPTQTVTPTPAPVALTDHTQLGRNPNIAKVSISQTVYDAINNAANTYGIPPQLLFDVGMAESTLNPNASNPKSTSAGLFMFNNGSWQTVQNYMKKPGSTLKMPDINRMNPYTSALAAAYLIKNGQLGRWDASKNDKNNTNSWGNYWNDEELKNYYAQILTNIASKE
jgi:hypothetical protein